MIPAAQAKAAFTVAEFCSAHTISRAFYYQLRSQGSGPTEMKVGARTLISIEAAAEWRRRMEEQTAKSSAA